MQLQLHDVPQCGIRVQTQLQQLFEKHLEKRHNSIALVYENQTITFGDLNRLSNSLALSILTHAYNEKCIAVSCMPSIQMVISVLAILKAGKAFVPIEAHYNSDKISKIISETGIRFITDSNDVNSFNQYGLKSIEIDESASCQLLPFEYKSTDTAYIVYTSGSTGSSKGIEVRHNSIVQYVQNAIDDYCTDNTENNCSFFHLSLAFDASLTALFASLCSGKTLVIGSRKYSNVFQDPNYLQYAPYDFIKITPYQIFELESIQNDNCFKTTNCFVLGGETLYNRHLKVFKDKNISVDIVNEYGPSETCVGCISYRFNTLESTEEKPFGIPVGKPMKGTEVFVLNRNSEQVKNGEYGEIVIGGVQVADSYIANENQSKQRFVTINNTNTGSEFKYYKTGDFAQINSEGLIEFVCREDKMEAFQMQTFIPAKLEAELMKITGIRHVFVQTAKDENQILFPICYIKLEPNWNSLNQLKTPLSSLFKHRRFPIICAIIDEFPLTSNKKLNRHKLPKISLSKDSKIIFPELNSFDTTTNQLEILHFKYIVNKRYSIVDKYFNIIDIVKMNRQLCKIQDADLSLPQAL